MNSELVRLGLLRAIELGQEALTAHEDLWRWQAQERPEGEKSGLSAKLKNALGEQNRWLRAVAEELEGDDE